MKTSRDFIIFFALATVAVVVCLCASQANAAPRNGQNRTPMRGNGNRNSNNNDHDYQGGYSGVASSAQVEGRSGVDPEESNQSEINDESGAVDPEFAALTDDGSPESAASNSEADESSDEPLSPVSGASAAGLDQPANDRSSWMGGANARSSGSAAAAAAAAAANEELYGEPNGQDSNIDNAKIKLSSSDMATAAGHHYHGHGVHGWLEMGAHTGKKGAFGWHDKHPVGGKGRR